MKVAIYKNFLATSSFNIALEKKGIMRLFSQAKIKEWPEGAVYIFVRMLTRNSDQTT
jgi:hypothetical protein